MKAKVRQRPEKGQKTPFAPLFATVKPKATLLLQFFVSDLKYAERRLSDAFPDFKVVSRLVIDSRVLGIGHQRPLRRIDFWKPRVAIGAQRYASQVQAIRLCKALSIKLRAADQHHLVDTLFLRPLLGAHDCGIQRREDFRALELQISLAADHQVQATGQGAAQRIPGLATHDDRLAERRGLEVFEIPRQMPGHGIVDADHSVFTKGSNQAKGEMSFHAPRISEVAGQANELTHAVLSPMTAVMLTAEFNQETLCDCTDPTRYPLADRSRAPA
ncbi:hypothetical protein ALP33_102624 [Pseudomonas amygdali pv. lachrymans]|uniref:Uncharacterized protein n=1 Tax=Pseudomonas amygdali pv. lachrymans TaxID=53707 RepID=A0AB37RCA3_PSEAV|nr:hypothetical protein ALP33_102624 [Pseudomonas amygdali pv. lachrymans]